MLSDNISGLFLSTATTPSKTADLFNKYFASVFLPRSSANNTLLDCVNPKTCEEIPSIEISECKVEHYRNNLDTSKAYGPDGPMVLLKECSKEISSSLLKQVAFQESGRKQALCQFRRQTVSNWDNNM